MQITVKRNLKISETIFVAIFISHDIDVLSMDHKNISHCYKCIHLQFKIKVDLPQEHVV